MSTPKAKGRIYTYDSLPEKGITFHRVYILRLVKAGKFPQPFYMSERRPAWTEAALDQWIAEREANREAERERYKHKREAERDAQA